MGQMESLDRVIWIFQGKSGKQTDSRSKCPDFASDSFFRTLSRLFRCSRLL
jgi:hypothetical protein